MRSTPIFNYMCIFSLLFGDVNRGESELLLLFATIATFGVFEALAILHQKTRLL